MKKIAHPRAELTTDCVVHEAEHTVPCWCGATDAPAKGTHPLSSEPWTPDGIAWLIGWLQPAFATKKAA